MMNKTELQTEIARRKEADFAYLLLSDEQIEREILEEEELAQKRAGALKQLKGDSIGREAGTTASLAAGALATARRSWFQSWYQKLGFAINIPFPPVSDKEFNRRKALGQALFYRPAASEVSYEAFMKAVGKGRNWMFVNENDRGNIVWEPTQTGYWFWAEVVQDCPRLCTSWNGLVLRYKLNLLSLEEYEIVWQAHSADANILLDTRTWSWLRTRFGRSALRGPGYNGGAGVDWWDERMLDYSADHGGGRLAEVVKNVS